MAKVKDQVLPGSDISYIDSTGIVHYDADLVRHIMPNAYPLPSLNPTGVAKKTSRNKRPPDQGNGSPDQYPRRACFRLCADRWNAIQDECETGGSCTPSTSKKNIWDAKTDQGVMCSYYDLYMSCCMNGCVEVYVKTPEGNVEMGGKISPEETCWPCPPIDLELPLSIEYTTTQMRCGESQFLGLNNIALDCCPGVPLIWQLSGGGSLSVGEDSMSATYNAPATNPNCSNNGTVSVTDCFGRTASVSFSSNCFTATTVMAFTTKSVVDYNTFLYFDLPNWPPPDKPRYYCAEGNVALDAFNCDGAQPGNLAGCWHCALAWNVKCNDCGFGDCFYPPNSDDIGGLFFGVDCHGVQPGTVCNPFSSPFGITDIRTDAQKEAGCCPEGL